MAATSDIRRIWRKGDAYGFPVLGGVRIYGGSMIGVTANLAAVPAAHASCVALVGFAEEAVDNRDGSTGDKLINACKGVTSIPLSDATPADIGKTVYASADDTFTLVAGSLLKAGIIDAIDADGVWLKTI
ncbi:putative RecA/RadA family phage recombinase [Agrobacterium vitis]|nr:putative RecA/RadA family phage recombinase [Agrobacterium vitis]MBE1439834.1 putative RecA/RadA family phage recombinase [Agrobacterium vitis]